MMSEAARAISGFVECADRSHGLESSSIAVAHYALLGTLRQAPCSRSACSVWVGVGTRVRLGIVGQGAARRCGIGRVSAVAVVTGDPSESGGSGDHE